MNTEQIQLTILASLLLKSTIKCCQLMHQRGQDFKIAMKQFNDPVTQVDYLIQNLLVSNIKKIFKSINIVGQQDLSQNLNNFSYLGKQLEITQTNNIQLPHQLQNLGKYQCNDLCVWIDPLDCTRGFISNLKYQCTVLIGVSYKGKPILGVIGQPYKRINNTNQYQYNPTITVGSIQSISNCALEYWINKLQWKRYTCQSTQKRDTPKIAISSRRNNQKQQALLSLLGAQRIKTGGAGHKALMLIRGQIDSLFFIGVETSKWDSCAGEAIIKAMGGFTIQPDLKDIEYLSQQSYKNNIGFIFSTKTLISQCIYNYLSEGIV